MRENQPHALTPTPRMSHTVWLSGVAVVLLLWAALVGAIGAASGRLLDVACEGRLLAPFFLFLCGWTGAWMSRRLPGGPGERRAAEDQPCRG